MKTKIAITQWIKNNFNNENDFENFLEYDRLNGFIQNGKILLPKYQEQYNELKQRWEVLHNTINKLPELEIVERFGNETHKTMRTPLNYMSYFYYTDCKRRIKLFKSA